MIPPAERRLEACRQPGIRARAVGSTAAALALLTALVAAPVAGPAAGPTASAHPGSSQGSPGTEKHRSQAPLLVSIDTMSPSTVPRRGTVTLTGEITNRSRSTWTDLNVYLFTSTEPMTTTAELRDATATDEALDVGPRLTAEELYAEVPDLAPGESAGYQLTVPRAELPFTEPGVYWLGVHVLGSNEQGRVDGADGRARTFIPLMDERSVSTTMSLLLPLRAPVRRTAEGQLAEVQAWGRRLGPEGRLGRLLDLAETAFDVPLTWVLDPAVLEAAGSLAAGNPKFDLAPTIDDGEPDPSESASPDTPLTETPDPDGVPDSEGTQDGEDQGAGEDPEEELGELTEEAATAEAWLTDLLSRARRDKVLALPYGDVDVATLLRGNFAGTFTNALQLSEEAMAQLEVDATPVVAPIDGLLPELGLPNLDPAVDLLLSERAVPADATVVRLRQGSEAVLTSEAARIGGPAPTPPFDALAIRQRVLAEAAVHGLTHDTGRPLVVSVPDTWNPGEMWRSAGFFSGLDVPWLRTVELSTARVLAAPQDHGGRLSYTRVQRRQEVPVANVLGTQELGAAGDVLAALLTENDTIDEQVARAAMLGSSVHVRGNAARARARTRAISSQVHRRLSRVVIEGSELVTMSSERGNFSVTVVNGLNEPVTVGIEAATGTDELEIRAPDLVSLGPGQRATVRLAVRATGTGVHSVRLVPTTRDGRPLDRSTTVKVRSSQVGLVIWLVMGTGAVVFFAAIAARIARRVRDRKRTHGPLLKETSQ